MSTKGWYGVDLDRTLAYYESGDGVASIGEPIPEMVKFVKEMLAEGKEVRIMTARVYMDGTLEGYRKANNQKMLIRAWCEQHLGKALPVTCMKDYNMITLYDDRAVQVVPNKGILVT